ncbi:beta-N-acetylhexosaminidase [bacterium]|nr:beta-N-acetylhexosaminidase [bacterium]
MKMFISLLLCIFFAQTSLSARSDINVIIPKPQKVESGIGEFILTDTTRYFSQTPLSRNALDYLQEHLQLNAGYKLSEAASPQENSLLFKYNGELGEEAYRLQVAQTQITLEAKSGAGFFYAMMSLMQLMPPAIWSEERTDEAAVSWPLPACTVEDYPRFRWRGMMLDSSRNFFSKTYVKKFIDRLAQNKINVFHWHLTDDEGWRIEIRQYPLLTAVGARRGPGTELPFSLYPAMRGPKDKLQEGYYTQDDIREIVAYAQKRSVSILPEIDVPGHAKAAVTAYPALLQDPGDKSRYTSVQKIGNNTIDAGLESSYVLLEEVIKEVAALFPFGYIHLGGDEIPKGAWHRSPSIAKLMKREGLSDTKEVQAYFFNRMDSILAKYGRKMVLWQEAGTDYNTLRDETVVMAWRGDGIRAAVNRHKVIMSPAKYLYFDQQYIKKKEEPGHTWAGPTDTEKVYSYRPVPETVTPEVAAFVQGVHGCLWSETVLNEAIADYLAWPRTFALAEIGWSDRTRRDWKDFEKRAFGAGLQRLDSQKINYRKPKNP